MYGGGDGEGGGGGTCCNATQILYNGGLFCEKQYGTVSSILLLNTDLAVAPLSLALPGILAL